MMTAIKTTSPAAECQNIVSPKTPQPSATPQENGFFKGYPYFTNIVGLYIRYPANPIKHVVRILESVAESWRL